MFKHSNKGQIMKYVADGNISRNGLRGTKVLRKGIAAFVAALQLTWGPSAWALNGTTLPAGGQITAGSGAISQSGATMQISQSSQQLITNWNSFSIGQNATVNFNQPNSSATALNRVIGTDVSQIAGRLTANGRVVLINPSGVVFTPTGHADVGALVATTLNMADSDFLSGTYKFSNSGVAGAVVNQGSLTAANGGFIAFLGPQVTNSGTISATNGSVVLGAGDRVTLDFAGNGLINMSVDAATVNALADNKGLIQADGGHVMMTAHSLNALTDTVVNNEGIIRARGISNKNGVVTLDGGDSGATTVNGTIDVTGTSGTGGQVAITGGQVNLLGSTSITALAGAVSVSGTNGVFLDKNSTVTAQSVAVAAPSILGSGNVVAAGSSPSITLTGDYISLAGALTADNPAGAGGAVVLNGGSTVMLSGTSRLSAGGASGGTVRVSADTGFVLASGALQAIGSTGQGGQIQVSGAGSSTLLGATLNASGAKGGGTINIGGGWHGTGDQLVSSSTTVDTKSTLTADATQNGPGGEVVLWSQNSTSFWGNITARGGILGGNGGRVELSSAGQLNVQTGPGQGVAVNARAVGWNNGAIVADPADVVIGDVMQPFDIWKSLLTAAGNLTNTGATSLGLTSNSYFGYSVALNSSYALIGANGVSSNRGDAYLYNLGTGTWTDLAATSGTPVTGLASGSNFGNSVALNSSYALIGAQGVLGSRGDAYLYNLGTGAWIDLAADHRPAGDSD